MLNPEIEVVTLVTGPECPECDSAAYTTEMKEFNEDWDGVAIHYLAPVHTCSACQSSWTTSEKEDIELQAIIAALTLERRQLLKQLKDKDQACS